MTKSQQALADFKARMRRVASLNEDDFTVNVTVDENNFEVDVTESADGHHLLTGIGSTLFKAIQDALADLPDALEQWGYKNCD